MNLIRSVGCRKFMGVLASLDVIEMAAGFLKRGVLDGKDALCIPSGTMGQPKDSSCPNNASDWET